MYPSRFFADQIRKSPFLPTFIGWQADQKVNGEAEQCGSHETRPSSLVHFWGAFLKSQQKNKSDALEG
jgi:hypothetical protein